MRSDTYQLTDYKSGEQTFVTLVYGWMFLALALSGLVAMQVASSKALVQAIAGTPLFFGLIIFELLLVIGLTAGINKISSTVATAGFILYAAVNGATLSLILLIYTAASVATTFFIAAGMFGAAAAYGYFTKKDLASWGSILFMGLIGIIIATIVNIFVHSSVIYWAVTFIGVIIFTGLAAYDNQKIKKMARNTVQGSESAKKGAIMGALALYLDFINLFLFLLRIFGRRR